MSHRARHEYEFTTSSSTLLRLLPVTQISIVFGVERSSITNGTQNKSNTVDTFYFCPIIATFNVMDQSCSCLKTDGNNNQSQTLETPSTNVTHVTIEMLMYYYRPIRSNQMNHLLTNQNREC